MNNHIGSLFMVLFLFWWGGINSELNLNHRLQYTSVSVFLQKSTTSVFLQKSTTSVFLTELESTTSVYFSVSVSSEINDFSVSSEINDFSVSSEINDFSVSSEINDFSVDISSKINVNLCQQKLSVSSNLLFLVLTVCDPFNLKKKKITN